MQTGECQGSVNPDYEKRSWLTLGLFACFKTSKMESSITATPPSCQGKGEKGIISRRCVCLVIPICLSLFCECLLSQLFAMPKAHFSFGCISNCILQLSQFIKYSRESVLQLFDRTILSHIDEARDLCRVHSLLGYNNTWSLSPIRARIKEKSVACALSIEL